MTLPAKKSEDPFLKKWETLWKRFHEVAAFIYDNEGVIESLHKQLDYATLKKTLKGQMYEVAHLIDNHQHELLTLTEKIHTLAEQKGIESEKDFHKLKDAIKKLDLDQMKKSMELLKKNFK